MKTIMVSGRNFKCSLEIDIDDDLIPECQMFLGMVMKLTESTFYSKRVLEVSEKIGKIVKEELAVARKLLAEE